MKRIILIDDQAEEARDLASSLRSRGWDVTVAHSARAAFDLVAATQPDVIVTELALPDAHGLHVARALRSLAERDLVIVALTRLADQLGERALAAGYDHVARKPAHVDTLHARLDHLVTTGRALA
jgi:two-component system KDP operon response regulator KdpE